MSAISATIGHKQKLTGQTPPTEIPRFASARVCNYIKLHLVINVQLKAQEIIICIVWLDSQIQNVNLHLQHCMHGDFLLPCFLFSFYFSSVSLFNLFFFLSICPNKTVWFSKASQNVILAVKMERTYFYSKYKVARQTERCLVITNCALFHCRRFILHRMGNVRMCKKVQS